MRETDAAADPEGLLEYSVVFTDRSLNHMSRRFQGVMRDVSAILKEAYGARSAIVVPGGGTFGMESVARQFATDRPVVVIRNGWFSYRWTQILETGRIASGSTVLKARPQRPGPKSPYAPPSLDDVVATIRKERPACVFAPHVETAAGIVLPDDYLRAVGDAARDVGALFVLDCIASGALWVDMDATGVDVLITAPQKGWSGSPGTAFVMLGERAREQLDRTTSTSFAADLRKWLQIMEAYENGGHAYHATLPTDALALTHRSMVETRETGFETLRARQLELGRRVRASMKRRGLPSVAADGFEAAGVVVSYTDDANIHSGKAFIEHGLQTAAGVPLMCDEPADYRTFRVGLFGLDKLNHVDRTVARLDAALDAILPERLAVRAAA